MCPPAPAAGLFLFANALEGLRVRGLHVHDAACGVVSLSPFAVRHLKLRAITDRANAAIVPGRRILSHGNTSYVRRRLLLSPAIPRRRQPTYDAQPSGRYLLRSALRYPPFVRQAASPDSS